MSYLSGRILYVTNAERQKMANQLYLNEQNKWVQKGTGYIVIVNEQFANKGNTTYTSKPKSGFVGNIGKIVADAVNKTMITARTDLDAIVSGTANKNWYKDTQDLLTSGELKDQDLGWSKVTFDDKINYFNISMLPDYENAAEPYFAFILMTRPSLRLTDANIKVLEDYPMTGAYVNDKYGRALLKSISAESNNIWVPLITTQAKSYSVADTEIDTIEKGATYYGHTLKYGKHSEKHKLSNTISIDFRNDRFLSILKMMQIWMGYIYIVSKTDWLEPLPVYQKTGILDYAGSIYYLVTRRDMRELVYWEKLTGVFPLKSPYSIFNYNDTPIIEDTIGIEFSYGIRSDPNDPNVLLDINALNGVPLKQQNDQGYIRQDNDYDYSNGVFTRKKVGYEHFLGDYPFTKGDLLVTHPYITVQKDNSGNVKYFLHWVGDPEHRGNTTTFARTATERGYDNISRVSYNAEQNSIKAFDDVYATVEDGQTGTTWKEYLNAVKTGKSVSPEEFIKGTTEVSDTELLSNMNTTTVTANQINAATTTSTSTSTNNSNQTTTVKTGGLNEQYGPK